MDVIIKAALKPHARLGASSAHRWMKCPGSIRMASGTTAQSTGYQEEGTAAHALLERGLNYGDALSVTAVEVQRPDETWATIPVLPEMRAAMDVLFQEFEQHVGPGIRHETELGVSLAALRPPEEMMGSADLVAWGEDWLRVWDLKYGRGVVVEVIENEQLLYYLLGAYLAIPVNQRRAIKKLFVTIVQPRAPHADGPVRTWEVPMERLKQFSREVIVAAHATQREDAPLVVGEWCGFCPAQGACPELKKHAQLTAQMDFSIEGPQDTPVNPEHLTVEECGKLLSQAKILDSWIRALNARVEQALRAGSTVPGWKLVDKRATRVWSEPAAETAHALAQMGLEPMEIMEVPALKSPAQIEKIVGKNRLPETMVSKVSSGVTLVPDSDPRPVAMVGPEHEFEALPPGATEAQIERETE